MTLAEAQDLAYRRLRGQVSTCNILKVYVSIKESSLYVVIGEVEDYKAVSARLWRAVKEIPVTVIQVKQDTTTVTGPDTYVCYQNGRWVH